MQIGNVSVPEHLVLMGASIALALFSIAIIRKILSLSSNATDLAFETVVTFIIAWKASLIIVSPLLVVESPLSLLYFTGGETGYIIGLFISMVYLHWKLKGDNRKNNLYLLGFGLLIGTIGYEAFHFPTKSSLLLIVLLLSMVLLMVYWKSYEWRFLDLMLWGSILIFIVGMIRQDVMFHLSKQQWLYLFVAVYTVWAQYDVFRRKAR
ncbi:hypothetical protein [Alkalihalobacillus sp. CinArs1]|uniref:hypothetical protein n=1 Tax=Alkalihalobacillus sp. CinArs1 TaxID=2995314 RepID=UPI0022DE7678|nr:hypothetical protein [Alkalihalobacillus sp. CinArs1]